MKKITRALIYSLISLSILCGPAFSATPLIDNVFHITDSKNNPVPFGKVYTYEPGTTTPKVTYSDEDGTVPHSNPVDLDAEGKAMIYGYGAFTIDVKDMFGSQVNGWPKLVDSYAQSSEVSKRIGTIAELRTHTGYTGESVQVLGYYTPGDGSGGPTRIWKTGGAYVDNGGSIITPGGIPGPDAWVLEWSNPFNVKWFGAVGDGIHDDYENIQSAINYIASLPYASALYVPSGTYYTSSVLTTPVTPQDDEAGTFGIKIFGDGSKSILTRKNASPVNFSNATISDAIERHNNAALAVRSGQNTITNLSFRDCYIGLYLGDNPNRTDIDLMTQSDVTKEASVSHNKFERMYFYDSGVGIYSESTHGTYYNSFFSILFRQMQVGFVSREISETRVKMKTNRNTFLNVRANRCVIGYMLRDANTNIFNSVHAEDCDINATGIPDGLTVIPSSLSVAALATDFSTNGGGMILESTAAQNRFFGCVFEANDNDLFNSPSNNEFSFVDFDLASGKVFFENVPKMYNDANTEISQFGSYHSWGAGSPGVSQIAPDRVLPGFTPSEAEQGVPFIVKSYGLFDSTTISGKLREHGFVDVAESLANGATHTINIAKVDTSNGGNAFAAKVIISTRDTSGSNQYYHELNIAAGVSAGSGITRYDIVNQIAYKTNGAGSSAVSADIIASLSTGTTTVAEDTLVLSLQCANPNGFDALISSVTVIGGVKL